ncbi:DNA polymerase phi-domain-containing protein [Phellopilus nigrolimitatus]|nr:DNA polymerase phi-domain-containing protein [Phellopilus nigrolimitatus]
MAAAATTLPLFWHLSSAGKGERIDASVKLVSALQQFQENFVSETGQEEEDEEDSEGSGKDDDYDVYSSRLDASNAADVAYAIRRLIRGLASPRESSRIGFAVALTELFVRIDTVTCQQVLVLLNNASQTAGGMSGQEERDMFFARLFGLKAILQSGLLFRQRPLRTSSTSSGSLKAFETFLTELLTLGEKKSWLKESCWWTLASAVDALYASDVQWKNGAFDMLIDRVFIGDKSWGPEKVAVTLKLQKMRPEMDWETFCGSYFKSPDLLATTNLISLGRILKDSVAEGTAEDDTSKHSAGPWKPQLHFVWDVILDILFAPEAASAPSGKFQDFYRIVVDETLFSASSSPLRKYWGFLVFQKALRRLPPMTLPLLFTKNFMRSWINQLSKNDRYLHKIARQVASDVHEVVEKDPKAGFTLVLQLTGTNGSFHFDRITKTKTVETILANMDSDGIKVYIDYLLKQVNEEEESDSFASIGARRAWIVDQMTSLIRKGSIPKNDESIGLVLNWLTTHAFFNVSKKSSKSTNLALRTVPEPPFTEELQNLCKTKLLACLGDLTSLSTTVGTKDDVRTIKATAVAADGEYWISKVLRTIVELEKDIKHVKVIQKLDGEAERSRNEAMSAVGKIDASANGREPASGAILLLNALTLKCFCDDEDEADWETLHDCVEASTKLFVPTKEKKKKKKQQDGEDGDERAPIDLIVDIIIGLLEQSTSFTRMIANQSFAMLSPLATDSTIDLILAQLERRDPGEENVDEDEETDEEESKADSEDDDDDDDKPESADEDEDEDNEEEGAEELRKVLQAAMSTISAKEAAIEGDESDGSSDDASMDDEQMMQIDEKLAEVFRTRTEERKKGKDVGAQREATYFKNRVLDLVETFVKKQPSSSLVLRFILPLVELVSTASSDEKQLSDKAKGILRSRLAKTKDAIPIPDPSKAVELLESLHQRARKSHSSDTVSTISLCSLFVTKALLTVDEKAAIRIYTESTSDFLTRKASALNTGFILDFVRRFPLQAWGIRMSVVEMIGNATNGYRQTQAFNIVQTILTSLPQPDSKKDEILAFMPSISKVFSDIVFTSCTSDKPVMTAGQMKEALKVALQLCRFSKRIASDTSTLKESWSPKQWSELATKLSSSEHFRASISLAGTCQQISQLVQSQARSNSKADKAPAKSDKVKSTSALKRKQEVETEGTGDGDSAPRKPKRKKVRKAPKAAAEAEN